jgi:hypothetical protein
MVDIRIILSVKVLISIKYDISIKGAAFCTVVSNSQFAHLNSSITPGNHQWKSAPPLFSRRGVQMIIGVLQLWEEIGKKIVMV